MMLPMKSNNTILQIMADNVKCKYIFSFYTTNNDALNIYEIWHHYDGIIMRHAWTRFNL
jgi:hypothetical protein